jgi:hypothetical protein
VKKANKSKKSPWHCGPPNRSLFLANRLFDFALTNMFFFVISAFFPAFVQICIRSKGKAAWPRRATKMLWRKKVREFKAQKEFNATSLRNQFYSIFWLCRFVYKLELKIRFRNEVRERTELCDFLFFFFSSPNNSLQSPLTLRRIQYFKI